MHENNFAENNFAESDFTDKRLSQIKYNAGIFYSDEQLDDSVRGQISACDSYLLTAGVSKSQLLLPLATTLCTLWVEASRNNSLASLPSSDTFICLITQLRCSEREGELIEK